MLNSESLIIALAIAPAAQAKFYDSFIARAQQVIENSLNTDLSKDQCIVLAQSMLDIFAKKHEISGDDEVFEADLQRVDAFMKKSRIDKDDRMLHYLSGFYENSKPQLSRHYAEEALKAVKKNKTGGERLKNAAMHMYMLELSNGNLDKAFKHRLESVGAGDKKTVDSLTMRFYSEAQLWLSQQNLTAEKLSVARKGLEAQRKIDAKSERYIQQLASVIRCLIDCNLYSEARLALYSLTDLCRETDYNIYNVIDKYSIYSNIYAALGIEYDGLDELKADLPLIKDAFGKYSEIYRNALRNISEEYIGRKDYTRGIELFRQLIEIESIAEGIFYDPVQNEMPLRTYLYWQNPSDSLAAQTRSYLDSLVPIYDTPGNLETIKGRKIFLSLCDYREYFALLQDDYSEAFDIRRRQLSLLSKHDHQYLDGLDQILYYASVLKNHDAAYSLMHEYESTFRSQIAPQLILMTDEERSVFWPHRAEKISKRIHAPLFGRGGDRFAGFAYNYALLNKGLLLQSTRAIDHALENTPELHAELAAIIQRQKIETDTEAKKQLYVREKEILADIASQTEWGKFLNLSWQNVREALPDSSIAVEFCAFGKGEDARYGALVLARGVEPSFIDLFKAESLSESDNRYQFLADSVWAPIIGRYPEVSTIYFSPVGELCRQPLEAAQSAGDDMAMSDRFMLFRLSSTREIAIADSIKPIRKGIVMGGLEYDMDEKDLAADTRHHRKEGIRKRESVRNYFSSAFSLEYLPGTEVEAETVAELAREANLKFKVYKGKDGTEASFKALSGGDNNILHIATHGFYWTEEEARYMPKFDYLFRDLKSKEDRSLARSGLMLAGANLAYRGMEVEEGSEDGILTAREIADLDLSAADFVILSACQTGLGDISGEGVFGLQRGFKKAGVKSMMLSLWKVADEATAMLMDEFYRSYFSGMSKIESMKRARNHLRSFTAEDGGHPYDSPEYWGAFILLDAK